MKRYDGFCFIKLYILYFILINRIVWIISRSNIFIICGCKEFVWWNIRSVLVYIRLWDEVSIFIFVRIIRSKMWRNWNINVFYMGKRKNDYVESFIWI